MDTYCFTTPFGDWMYKIEYAPYHNHLSMVHDEELIAALDETGAEIVTLVEE